MRKYSAYFKKLRTMSRSNYSVNDITAITCELYIVACIFYAFLFHPKTQLVVKKEDSQVYFLFDYQEHRKQQSRSFNVILKDKLL